MGGNSSVSLDSDDEIAFVKGIRLSERVVDRTTRSLMQSPATPPVPEERHLPIMPHSPSYASALVPPPLPEPPVTEEASTPPSSAESPEGPPIVPPTGNEHVVVLDPQPGSANILIPDPQPAEPVNAPSRVSSEPITAPPLVESTNAPVEPLIPPPVTTSTTDPITIPPSPTTDTLTEPVTSLKSSVELVIVPTEPIESVETPSSSKSADPMVLPVEFELDPSPIPISKPNPSPILEESTVFPSGSAPDVVLPDEMISNTQMDPPSTEKPLPPVDSSLIDKVEVFPPQTHVVNEEKLRKQIREDLQKLLKEEMKMAERNMRQQVEEEKAKAQAQIQEEVQKVLEEEKSSHQHTLTDAVIRDQLNIQDERLITQCYWMERKVQKTDEEEKDLENQKALFQEQIAKMQEKTAQFSKVTAENYRKGLEDTTNRFRRFQIKPVCLDLQAQIMKCYAENKGQTMRCSNIASLYVQCVNRARQLSRPLRAT